MRLKFLSKKLDHYNCEFQMGESERPILETKADNTTVMGAKITTSTSNESRFLAKLSWKFVVPLIVAVTAGIILYFLFGNSGG